MQTTTWREQIPTPYVCRQKHQIVGQFYNALEPVQLDIVMSDVDNVLILHSEVIGQARG